MHGTLYPWNYPSTLSYFWYEALERAYYSTLGRKRRKTSVHSFAVGSDWHRWVRPDLCYFRSAVPYHKSSHRHQVSSFYASSVNQMWQSWQAHCRRCQGSPWFPCFAAERIETWFLACYGFTNWGQERSSESCESLTFDFNRHSTVLGTFTHLPQCADFTENVVSSAIFCSEYLCFPPVHPPQRLIHFLSFQLNDLPSPHDHLVCLFLIARDLR